MTSLCWTQGVCAAALWISLLMPGKALAAEPQKQADAIFDCGTLALYTLLRLEGHRPDLQRIESHLPAPSARGNSMRDLRNAARSYGLSLSGVRVQGADRAPDRPMLAFLLRPPHGHFLVVRPVGHTGKLVQILDGIREPYVLDAVDLYDSPEWTGLALIPQRPNWPARIAVGSIGGSVLVALAYARLRKHRALASSSTGVISPPNQVGSIS